MQKQNSIPFEVNTKLLHSTKSLLPDPTVYRQLTVKLMYIQLTSPDIAYSLHMISVYEQAFIGTSKCSLQSAKIFEEFS